MHSPAGIHSSDLFRGLIIKAYLRTLLRRLLGVRTEGDKKGAKVQKLAKNEVNNHQQCMQC